MTKHTPGVREDRRTGQFVPTIDGKDTSPTSYDESRALEIAKQQCATITPGPLEVHITDGGAVYVTDNHRFADATFIVRIDSEQNRNPEAMGKLFASAPDLLAACEALVWLANDHDWEETHLPELKAARTAISKAKAQS